MITDGIMTAVQAVIDRFTTPEERHAGEVIWDMLGDFDEDHWADMNNEEKDKWIENYIK